MSQAVGAKDEATGAAVMAAIEERPGRVAERAVCGRFVGLPLHADVACALVNGELPNNRRNKARQLSD